MSLYPSLHPRQKCTIYDPVNKEVIEDALYTLTVKGRGPVIETKTDGFGDFWFDWLEVEIYDLQIEAKGFARKTISAIHTKKDVNLGDIPLKWQLNNKYWHG